jgi:hypothetical protein
VTGIPIYVYGSKQVTNPTGTSDMSVPPHPPEPAEPSVYAAYWQARSGFSPPTPKSPSINIVRSK